MPRHSSTVIGAMMLVIVLCPVRASADFRLERRLALSPGQTLTVEAHSASVALTGDSSSGATVTLTSGRDDFDRLFDVLFNEGPNGLTITIKRRWDESPWRVF